MQLQFKEKYISIDEFNPVELPNFTVLTGVNGSGKSHLLRAINEQKINIADMDKPSIVLFNYETFKLDNEGSFNALNLSTEREQAWSYQQGIKSNVKQWLLYLGDDYARLKDRCIKEQTSFLDLDAEELKSYQQNFNNFFRANKQNQQAQAVYAVAKKIFYSIDEMEHDDFIELCVPITLKQNFLPNQLGKICWDYYIKQTDNDLREMQNEKYSRTERVFSEEEFIYIQGRKPWELINEILETFNTIHYRVNSPEGMRYNEHFKLKLLHMDRDGIEIDFDALSSGEKILLALVASAYKTNSDKFFPDILLLDEIDASLHPSMIKNMLDVVEKTFVREGTNVILVTHSPTTIAFAPEGSVYVMNKSGLNRIEKKPKQDALNILTQGFVTLEQGLKLFDSVSEKFSIITEGRNTVLIEKALEFYGIKDVAVMGDFENITSKSQLKTLFDFFSKREHGNKVLFVWDCDATEYKNLESACNTHAFVLPKNENNQIAKKGVENMFSKDLFNGFTTQISIPGRETTYSFHESCKKDFEKFVIGRNNLNDFKSFVCLVDEIKRIKAL